MDPYIRDGAASTINKYGTAPEYVKYQHGDEIIFGKVEHHYWNDSSRCFILKINHTKPIISWPGQSDTLISRKWPFADVNGKRVKIEEATEAEYMMSSVLES